MATRWHRIEHTDAPMGHALEGRVRGTTWRTWSLEDGTWRIVDALDPQRSAVVGSLQEARDLAENGHVTTLNPQAIHMSKRRTNQEHGRAAVHRRELRKAEEAARAARSREDREDALKLAEHHRQQLALFGTNRNPRRSRRPKRQKMPPTRVIDINDLAVGDLIWRPFEGVPVEILRSPLRETDRLGLPILRFWARRTDTGDEGFITYGPIAKVDLIIAAPEENPRGKQWFVAAVQGPHLFPVGPVVVVDRNEAGRLSQIGGGRTLPGHPSKHPSDILLAGFSNRSEAEDFAKTVTSMVVEISRESDGTIVYRGPLLEAGFNEEIRNTLRFVDYGRLYSIVYQPEMRLAPGKKALIVRSAAAANPETNEDIVRRAKEEMDVAYGSLDKARAHKDSGSGQAYVGYVQNAARWFQNAMRTAETATGRKARQIERDANSEIDELIAEFPDVRVLMNNPSPLPREASLARKIASGGL